MIIVLPYDIREEMKRFSDEAFGDEDNILINYSHWMRFIETIYLVNPKQSKKRGFRLKDAKNPWLMVDPALIPSFGEYIQWVKKYKGWSYGRLDENHASWKSSFIGKDLPMNNYY